MADWRPDDGKLASGRLNLNCNSYLKEKRVRTGIHVVRAVASIFPWKEYEAWSNTERRSDGLLRRPDGCKLEQKLLDAVKDPGGNLRRPDE
jgi:hypothetical protein